MTSIAKNRAPFDLQRAVRQLYTDIHSMMCDQLDELNWLLDAHDPDEATFHEACFYLRQIPDTLWVRVKQRAAMEGHSLRFIVLKLLEAYVRDGLPAPLPPTWPFQS